MKSTLKSVRIDDEILELVDQYRDLQKSIFGVKLSLTDIINAALPEYISSSTLISTSFLKPDEPLMILSEHGKMLRITLTEENIEQLKEINIQAEELLGIGSIHPMKMSMEEILQIADDYRSSSQE